MTDLDLVIPSLAWREIEQCRLSPSSYAETLQNPSRPARLARPPFDIICSTCGYPLCRLPHTNSAFISHRDLGQAT